MLIYHRYEAETKGGAVPDRDEIVVRAFLERNAAERRGVAVAFEDGTEWTHADALAQGYRAANVLRAAGVQRGDHVVVFLPNGADFLRAWWGTACLGAVLVPINLAWKGGLLTHAYGLTQPAAVVTGGPLAAAFRDAVPDAPFIDAATLADGPAEAPALDTPIEVWDRHHIQFTSGTTGPSKGAIASYRQFALTGSWAADGLGLDERDTILIDLPLFHAAALSLGAAALAKGTRLAVRAAPDLRNYWAVAKETGATYSFIVSAMVTFLLNQPESAADRDHSLRAMMVSPLPPNPKEFQRRFGIDVITTAYGSSEAAAPIVMVPGVPFVEGGCGQRVAPYEMKLVDEHDYEVPVGQPGELVVRSAEPWCLTEGYIGDPAATASLWRNGWLHTGDQLRVDEEGNYFFIDRLKDALRRRGENVSSYEVEREVGAYPGVAEAACVAAAVEGQADDEVKVWIVPAPEAEIDFPKLAEFLVDRLPHFMVPRFYELVDALPKTPAMRVKKFELRSRGNGAATWDLEANGLRVTRDGLVRR
jgi:crotonobetaine/carnitine-CoA ligase